MVPAWILKSGREVLYYVRVNQKSKPTSSVECRSGADAGPHDWLQAHCQGNGANSIIDVTERGSHCVRGDAQHILDDFPGPSKLRNDLFVGQGSEGSGVTPRVYGNLVLGHIFALEKRGGGDSAGADDKECGLERMFVKVAQEVGGVERRAVIVGQTPSVPRGTS